MPSPSGDREIRPRPRCAHCDDVIGAYERMVVDTPAGARETSLAAEPELFDTALPCFHRDCHRRARGADG